MHGAPSPPEPATVLGACFRCSLTVLFDFCECSHQGHCWTQGPNDSPYTFPNGGPSLGLAERNYIVNNWNRHPNLGGGHCAFGCSGICMETWTCPSPNRRMAHGSVPILNMMGTDMANGAWNTLDVGGGFRTWDLMHEWSMR